jgi:hypothetical protein
MKTLSGVHADGPGRPFLPPRQTRAAALGSRSSA